MAYTGIKFYVREKNKWSNLLRLRAGWDASFVLDKTTDTVNNINFIVKEEPEFLKINMWVALFINSEEDALTFNDDGTPKNHEQFIIGGYQYYKTLAGYEISLKLIEPIERFRGVLGETLSYTNQTSKVQDGITYTKDPYNYYSALKRWLQVTPANTDDFGESGEQRSTEGEAWWNRIKILDVDFLKGLPFADDTFNELSLYDLMFDVYDSGTGRTPVAYFDLDATTGLPYNSARDEYLLKFIRQDGLDKPVLDWSELTANKGNGEVCSGFMKREDGANYATGLVANITNLSPSTKVTFPAQGVYALPEALADVRDTTVFIEAGQGQWGLKVPHNIKKVNKLVEYSIGKGTGQGGVNVLFRDQEEKKVLERKERDATVLDDNDTEINYYEEGDNIVYLSGYSYDAQSKIALFYVEYEPLVDARVLIGDEEYVQQVNQTSSQVDSEKFGKFMTDYLAGMAKADYTIQRTTEKPQNYIGLIGSRVRRGDKTYMITNVAIRNRNFQYDVFFQLNENHVRKNMSYQAPQNIRANVAIQYDNIQDRKTVIKEKIKIGLKPVNNELTYLKSKAFVLRALGVPYSGGGTLEKYYPQFANVTNKSLLTGENNTVISFEKSISTNIAPFVVDNNICVNVRMLNNALSGKQKNVNVAGLRGGVENQIPILYVDPFGEIYKSSIAIVSVVDADLPPIVINEADSKYNDEIAKTKNLVQTAQNVNAAPLPVENTIIAIDNLNIQKDMSENFNITYSVEVSGDDGIKIQQDLLSYAPIVYNGYYVGTLLMDFYDDFDEKDVFEEDYQVGKIVGENYVRYAYHIARDPKSIKVKYRLPTNKVIDLLLINNYNNENWQNGFSLYF